MQKCIFILSFLMLSLAARSQDYFEDIKGGGVPLLLRSSEKKVLFSSRINPGADNSAKINLFKQYLVDEDGFNNRANNRHKLNLGWGLSAKIKTENGLGSLFGSGHVAPGYTGGAYLSLSRKIWKNVNDDDKANYSSWFLILSGTYGGAEFQLYDTTTQIFADQLKDTVFRSASVGLSFGYQLYPQKSNLFLGLSFKTSKQNNYGKLDKVDIKNDSIYTNGGGIVRTVTSINENGSAYAIGRYKEYLNSNIRFSVSYIPGFLDNQVAFVFYPSTDLSKDFKPKYNLGFSFNYLEKGSPSISKVALLFEFADLNNSAESTKPFFKRSFSIGFSAAFNLFSGGKE